MRTTCTSILLLLVCCAVPLCAETAPTADAIKARIVADRAAIALDNSVLERVYRQLVADDKAHAPKATLERDRAAVAYVKARLLADQKKLAHDLELAKLLGLTKPA
jgi:hypothetical protein